MKRSLLLISLLISLFLTSCAVGSRTVVTRARKVDGFTAVAMESVGTLTVAQGDHFEVLVTAESNVVDRIETVVAGDTLHVRMNGPWFRWGVVPTRNIRIAVTMPTVEALRISGVGRLEADGLRTETLAVQLNGAGNIDLRALDATELVVQHSGVGQCVTAGQVQRQRVQLSGAGRYEGHLLRSESADVQVSGVGQVNVWATATLRATISGAGSVGYWGEPELTERVTGVGRVRNLGPAPRELS